METFGERLKNARSKMKITQAAFAYQLEVSSQKIISNWENDVAKPEMDKLIKVAKILEVSIDWLLTGEEKERKIEGKISIAMEDFVEYMQLKNEKLKKENDSLKNIEVVHHTA
jgi:transcriptional regulator with XRE-family HTH domain